MKKEHGGMLTTTAPVTLLLAILAFFLVSAATAATVEIHDASANPDATTTTVVTAYEVENLANFGITVTFDPEVVNVTDITGGPDVGIFSPEFIADNQVRFYTLNTFTKPSLSGDVLLATLTLHAVGHNIGDTSPINMEIGTFVDADENPIPATTVNGTFTITEIETIPPAIEFVHPTPEDESEVTVNYVNITGEVTDESDVSVVLLNWNGTNETVSMIGTGTWSAKKTGLSNYEYTYRVYANDTMGNMGVSGTRVVGVVVVNATGLRGDMNGDGSVNMADVISLAKHVFFGDAVSDDPDVNSDGSVDMADVISLAKHVFFGDPIYP
jgi:hypothetical protein